MLVWFVPPVAVQALLIVGAIAAALLHERRLKILVS